MATAAKKRSADELSRVRAFTRTLLIDAALALFGRKGMRVPAIHEIAAQANVATGTFYNYFRTREELLEAAVVERSERLQREIVDGYRCLRDPAERVSVGCRRFMLQAETEPLWAAGLVRIWSTTPELLIRTLAPVLADLRAGRRAGRFVYRRESAAVDLLVGAAAAGIRSVLDGSPARRHGAAVAALILRGLGVRAAAAEAIARRPLPERLSRPATRRRARD